MPPSPSPLPLPLPPSPSEGRPSPLPLPPSPSAANEQRDIGGMTQWQLVRLKFSRHKLAVLSLFVLGVLYLGAILAEFVAPYHPARKHLSHIYAPPQRLRFDWANGLHTYPLLMVRDPETLTTSYLEERDNPVRLGLLVKGHPYKLWGLIPMERHLFGTAGEGARGEGQGARQAGEGARGEAGFSSTLQPAPFSLREAPPPTLRPSPFFLLGTDQYGRDLFSRIVHGARISLSIGLVSIAVSFVLGLTIGGVSGYVGGTVDVLVQRLIEILQAIPQLPLWIALGAILPPDLPALWAYWGMTIVLSFIGWTGLARTVRSKLLSLREEDYAIAARLLGASHGRIIFRHLLPGFASHIIVSLSLAIPGMILGETALSFLGLGLRPPLVSWGVLLQDCLDLDILSRHPWIIMPTAFVVLTVLAFNFVGDGMRDAADPYK